MAVVSIISGQVDFGAFLGSGSVTWTDLGSSPYATWNNWTDWNPQPNNIVLRVFEDAGSIGIRAPLLTFESNVSPAVVLKISDTIDSNGDLISPTTVTFDYNTAYTFVAGRYYEYTITVAPDSNTTIPYIQNIGFSFSMATQQEELTNVNTSTLSGTIDARTVVTNISVATHIVATAQEQGVTYSSGLLQDRVYAIPDDYVFQENAIVVNVVSKSPVVIRCFDLNGESIDAVIDITITGFGALALTQTGVILQGV